MKIDKDKTGKIETGRVPGAPGIAYDYSGSGNLVLFLHGIGGNRTNWRDQLPVFAPHFLSVAWDARGYGESDDYDGPLDFGDIARDLIRLIDHLGASRAHIVGLSMGSQIASDFYARHPSRVASLVLSGGRMNAGDRTPAQRKEFIRLRQEPLLAGKSPRDMAPAVAKTLLGPAATPDHYNRLVDSMAALHGESYLKAIEATNNYDAWPDIAAIRVPALLVYGADDRLNPASIGRAAAAQIPDSQFVEIPNAGHLCNIEAPETFNQAVLQFLLRRD